MAEGALGLLACKIGAIIIRIDSTKKCNRNSRIVLVIISAPIVGFQPLTPRNPLGLEADFGFSKGISSDCVQLECLTLRLKVYTG